MLCLQFISQLFCQVLLFRIHIYTWYTQCTYNNHVDTSTNFTDIFTEILTHAQMVCTRLSFCLAKKGKPWVEATVTTMLWNTHLEGVMEEEELRAMRRNSLLHKSPSQLFFYGFLIRCGSPPTLYTYMDDTKMTISFVHTILISLVPKLSPPLPSSIIYLLVLKII